LSNAGVLKARGTFWGQDGGGNSGGPRWKAGQGGPEN